MNWTGGSRNRLVMRNDAKKQREFFEKKKMQQKLKNMGIALPESPRGSSSASMDLVTLFIVNQIAAKKDIKDAPRVAVLGGTRGGSKMQRGEPLVLPMSPCSPSQLSLVEGQPHSSVVQATRKREHIIPQGFKCRQLSPVLESAFSDGSASDYVPLMANRLSPFSSTTSAASCQGSFPLHLNLQTQPPAHPSPPPWSTSGLEQPEFQPFSQARSMTDSVPWSCVPNPPLYQLETPTAALFRGPEPDDMEARDHARHKVTFSLNQSESKTPMLDFNLHQSETEQPFEAEVFRGFSADEREGEASGFGRAKSKIYLKDETPGRSSTPQTVPDSDCMGSELSNCTEMDFSCLEHKDGPLNCCEYTPNYSCQGGYLSSDSEDNEECCEPCPHAASSCMEQACGVGSLNPNLAQRHPSPANPLLRPEMNFRHDQMVVENMPDEALGTHNRHTAPKTSGKTRDAGTQTVDTRETSEASTQCSFALDVFTKGTGPPVVVCGVSVQNPATGGQTDTTLKSDRHTSPWSGGTITPWSDKMKSTAASFSGSNTILNTFPTHYADGIATLQRPINPFVEALSTAESKEKEIREGGDGRGQQENGRLTKEPPHQAREEVTSGARVNTLSDESETLQEIADILLLLKQRKEEGR